MCGLRALIDVRAKARGPRIESTTRGGPELMRISRWISCVSLAWCGAILAQTGTGQGAAAHLEGAEMNATLTHTVDARKAKPGDAVTATLTDDVRANGRLLLLRGTMLVGRVTEAQPRTRRADSGDAPADSRLGIEFETAVLRDGQEVPINATIQAVAAGEPSAANSAMSAGARGVFGIEGVQIVTAAAADGRTPLLVSSTGNVALKSGTQLLLVAHGEGAGEGKAAAGAAVGHESGASGRALGVTGS
jgi:hypothetical protein